MRTRALACAYVELNRGLIAYRGRLATHHPPVEDAPRLSAQNFFRLRPWKLYSRCQMCEATSAGAVVLRARHTRFSLIPYSPVAVENIIFKLSVNRYYI